MASLISIHAPVKGATSINYALPGIGKISIHAPVKGATYGTNVHGERKKFQSTLP